MVSFDMLGIVSHYTLFHNKKLSWCWQRRDAFSGQLRSTYMVPFWVLCDFSLIMWPPSCVTRV